MSECTDCGCDISARRGPAVRCEPCGAKRRREKQKEYAAAFNARRPHYQRDYQRDYRKLCRRPAQRCPPRAGLAAAAG